MKTLNFTVKEILSALLDKTKTQTIRKAWKKIRLDKTGGFCEGELLDITIKSHRQIQNDTIILTDNSEITIEKPAKYRVGEKVRIVWNEYQKTPLAFTQKELNFYWKKYHTSPLYEIDFGEVEITEVFQVEINKKRIKLTSAPLKSFAELMIGKLPPIYFDEYLIAKADGFKSPDAMFDYFDKNFEFVTRKKFWVYRYKWL